MRVLVTWGSERGDTEGIARSVARALREQGLEVDVLPLQDALMVRNFDAAIVGGALRAGRWHRAARRFVHRREEDLRRVPTWLFSSGSLDDSTDREEIPPTPQVQMLIERVGAIGHVTFRGTLTSGAHISLASAMKHASKRRNEDRIHAWALEVARTVPKATPHPAAKHPRISNARLVAYASASLAVMGVSVKIWLALAPLLAAALPSTLAALQH